MVFDWSCWCCLWDPLFIRASALDDKSEVLNRFHFDDLCGDFHEQLEFKFSWGLSKLITRISRANWSRNLSRVLIGNILCNSYFFLFFFFIKFFNYHFNCNIIISSPHLKIHQPVLSMVHLVTLIIVQLWYKTYPWYYMFWLYLRVINVLWKHSI